MLIGTVRRLPTHTLRVPDDLTFNGDLIALANVDIVHFVAYSTSGSNGRPSPRLIVPLALTRNPSALILDMDSAVSDIDLFIEIWLVQWYVGDAYVVFNNTT